MTQTSAAVPEAGDWRTLRLDPPGRSLIEASAGTGKTWAISVLFLRLLLECQLSPRQIVVTTFTNAAADELRERLRARVQWALRLAEHFDGQSADPEKTDESFLFARWQFDPTLIATDTARLRLALSELELAPVTTLHGLCRRVLADYPFASGAPFVLGEMADGRAMVADVAQDLWRRLQQGGDEDALAAAFSSVKFAPSRTLLNRLVSMLLTPGSRVADDDPPPAPLDARLATQLRSLAGRASLHVARTRKLKEAWCALADWLLDQSVPPDEGWVENLRCAFGDQRSKYLTPAADEDPQVQEVLAFCQRTCLPRLHFLLHGKSKHPPQALRALALASRRMLLDRLAAANQLGFDELILMVHDVLVDPGRPERAAALADALFAAWPVALVDEFQDTDSLQYAILDRIYRDQDGVVRGRMVMIGDPKQSIYRFRGGDIHAYLRAAAVAGADDRLALHVNHRSSRALVDAFNGLYRLCGDRLSAEEEGSPICYLPVDASARQDASLYSVGGEPLRQPLQIHYEEAFPESVGERRDLALVACANQIAAMLESGEHRIGEALVQPSDIAVLLPANAQLDQLRRLLAERGVPCVTTSRASVFSTDIARELQVLLHGVAHVSDPGALRAAVATRLWGESYAGLQALADDPGRWQSETAVFREWRVLWRQRGVQSVVGRLMDRVATRLLGAAQGERALTDLRHLGELLQAQAEYLNGPEELLAWFADQRAGEGSGDEESLDARQLRIESDARRVRLMTLHVSKGLEFPIVFLPLMWDHKGRRATDACLLSDTAGGRRLLSTSAGFDEDMREQQDESFRVFYVALTRAIHAVRVFALPPERPETAAKNSQPARGTARSALDAMLSRMQPGLDSAQRDAAHPGIRWVRGWHPVQQQDFSGGKIQVPVSRQARPLPPAAPGPLPARHSFTTLTSKASQASVDPEAAAGDETTPDSPVLAMAPEPLEVLVPSPSPPVAHPDIVALAAVRGADFGNAVHAIFEQRIAGQSMAAQPALIARQLAFNNVRHKELSPERLQSLLASRLQGVLDAPLGGTDGPRLGELSAADMRAEMEFNFALGGSSLQRLQQLCARDHGEAELIPSGHRSLAGLMTGKIDLSFRHDGRFHVLDYKGNYLGDAIEDYQGARLLAGMDKSSYRFQALLYTVAMDRYLRQRIPGYQRSTQLGDCWYVFVRAAGLAPAAGVWRHRFPDGLLDAVDRELGETSEGIAA